MTKQSFTNVMVASYSVNFFKSFHLHIMQKKNSCLEFLGWYICCIYEIKMPQTFIPRYFLTTKLTETMAPYSGKVWRIDSSSIW